MVSQYGFNNLKAERLWEVIKAKKYRSVAFSEQAEVVKNSIGIQRRWPDGYISRVRRGLPNCRYLCSLF